MDGYILVTEDSLDSVSEATGLPKMFWEREMNRINLYGGNLVVFPHEGQISQVTIDGMYDVAFVMKQKFGLEPHNG